MAEQFVIGSEHACVAVDTTSTSADIRHVYFTATAQILLMIGGLTLLAAYLSLAQFPSPGDKKVDLFADTGPSLVSKRLFQHDEGSGESDARLKFSDSRVNRILQISGEWLQRTDPNLYTMQLLGSHSLKETGLFYWDHSEQQDLAIVGTTREGAEWYLVLSGSYSSVDEARGDVEKVVRLTGQPPWIRRIGDVKRQLDD